MVPSNKTALLAAWNFFKGNYGLHFGTIGILVLLNLFGVLLPFVGILFIFAYSIFSLSIQIYFARTILEAGTPQELQEAAAQTRIGPFLTTYLPQASGGFLALLLLFILLFFLFSGILLASGELQEEMDPARMEEMAQSLTLPVLFLLGALLTLLYAFPGAMGRLMVSEDFFSAFKAPFTLFTPSLWRGIFNRRYFLLVMGWSLITTLATILFMALASTLLLLPVALVGAYLVTLYNGALYTFAWELSQELAAK
ncbi:MAG: hypothetical protein C6I00_01275 [Nitratiruptor sp.]|nr:hypothetical protein [Nitratiruptor sp.]NPA83227.1 hypothetical protein [Campylobacterota bacterium]